MSYLRTITALAAALVAGCGSCGRSPGFRFEWSNPPMISTPMILENSGTQYRCRGLGTYGTDDDASLSIIPRGSPLSVFPPRQMLQVSDSTISPEALNARIQALEAQLRSLRGTERLPMPRKCEPQTPEE